jgi:hypothetical protein
VLREGIGSGPVGRVGYGLGWLRMQVSSYGGSRELTGKGKAAGRDHRGTGHKTAAVFRRYNIVRSDSVRDAIARMENYRKGK